MSTTFTASTRNGQPCPLELELNVHAGGAALLADTLGLDTHDTAIITGEELLSRVLLALALTPRDEGAPASHEGRWTEAGHGPEYLETRLARLYELAEWAVAHHGEIAWG
jgi:hypothetical protein